MGQAHRVDHFGESPLINFECHKLLQHRLGQDRQLVAEPAGGNANIVARVKEVEAEFCQRRIVHVFGGRIREKLAQQASQYSVTWCNVEQWSGKSAIIIWRHLRMDENIEISLWQPEPIVALIPQSRYRCVSKQCRPRRRFVNLEFGYV